MSTRRPSPGHTQPGASPAFVDRRTVLQGAALLATGLYVGVPSPAEASLVRMTPRRARSVSALMGVRTHVQAANETTYGDVRLVGARMRELGVRHTREKLILPVSAGGYDNPVMAANQASAWATLAGTVPGFSVCCVVGRVDDSEGTVREFRNRVAVDLGGNAGPVAAVENGNEPNAYSAPWNQTDLYGWVPLTRRRQRQIADAFRSDPRTSRIRILGPSLAGEQGMEKYEALGDISASLDFGNLHAYPGNTAEGVPSGELRATYEGVKVNCGRKPVWATEMGFHNAMASAAPMSPYPEDVAAMLGPQVPLELARMGVRRGYYYELLDMEADPGLTRHVDHFGLVRADGSRKPIFHAVRNLNQILADRPGRTTLRPLAIGFVDAPATMRHLLLQRLDGRRFLCLWRTDSPWSTTTREPLPVGVRDVQVTFAERHDVRLYRPHLSREPVRTALGRSSFTVPLDSTVAIVEIL